MIIKPAREGSTIGLSKVASQQEFQAGYALAASCDELVMAEQFIDGVELTAAILDDEPLPLVRIDVPDALYDYHAKYCSDKTRYTCPSGLSDKLTSQIQSIALHAHRVLGCSGWSRVDVMLDQNERPFLLEANTSPGMTDHSLVPMAARTAGLSFPELVMKILETSL